MSEPAEQPSWLAHPQLDPRVAAAMEGARHPDPQRRATACQELLANGLVRHAEAVLASLEHEPSVTVEVRRLSDYARYVRRVLARSGVTDLYGNPVLSPESEAQILFGRSFDDVFILPRPGSHKLLLVFTGAALRFGVSLSILLRVLHGFDCNLVFLKDVTRRFYAHGVSGLGGTYQRTVAALQDLRSRLGADAVYCMGQSAGGYASIQYALPLSASGVLAFVPPTSLQPLLDDGRLLLPRDAQSGIDIVPAPFDLAHHLAMTSPRPQTTLVYGELAEPDASQAQRLAGIEGVSLKPVTGYDRHDVFHQVVADEQLEPLVEALLQAMPVHA